MAANVTLPLLVAVELDDDAETETEAAAEAAAEAEGGEGGREGWREGALDVFKERGLEEAELVKIDFGDTIAPCCPCCCCCCLAADDLLIHPICLC